MKKYNSKFMNFIINFAYCLMTIAILNLLLTFENNNVEAIEFEDLDIDYVNGEYVNMSNLEISVNRRRKSHNTLNINVQVLKESSLDFNVKCSATTRAFGHELPTGLAFHSKVCEPGRGKLIYDILVRDAGINECPPKKGLYQLHDLDFDLEKLNIFVPSGLRFQLQVEIFSDDVTKLAQFRFFILT